MKAICLSERELMEIQDVEEHRPGPGEVAVAPDYVGLCGTDLHVFLVHGIESDRMNRITGFWATLRVAPSHVVSGILCIPRLSQTSSSLFQVLNLSQPFSQVSAL